VNEPWDRKKGDVKKGRKEGRREGKGAGKAARIL
jgi:hypothetical protein